MNPWSIVLGAQLVARLAVAAPQDTTPPLQITFLDVGQADAVLIQEPGGRTALVDAGRRQLVQALKERGVTSIDLLVATHPHADHIGGMAGVLAAFPVRFYMDNGKPHTTATYTRLMQALEARPEITYLNAEPRRIRLGAAVVEVLPLLPVHSTDQNNRSVALLVRYGAFASLLTGDSEVEQLNFLVGKGAVPDVTVLKAPHHGSHNGFTPAFLRATRPEVVVISLGSNGYGHPAPEALAAFSLFTEHVYRTDRDGSVTVLGFPDGRHEVVLSDAAGG